MRKLISCFILAYIALFLYPTNFKPSSGAAALSIGNETDRLALLAFEDRITQDPLNVITSWNTSTHFCKWQGVSCSTRHPGRVTLLNLAGKKLTGSLPSQLGNLSFLRGKNLENNSFQGIIPQEFGRLTRLKYLNLSSNAFQGEIPTNLSYCSEIQFVYLSYNNLVGKIPEELSSLSTNKLKWIKLSVNGLTGSIPRWLGNVSSLLDLRMARNYFQGTIPSELGRLRNLEALTVAANNLWGEIPPSIYNISSLLYLDVSINQFYGKIPQDIGFNLPNLLGINVAVNQFTGHLPISLSNASGLRQMGCTYCNFTGTMLTNLGSLKDLVRLTVGGNQLETDKAEGFSFLTSLTNCSNLQTLDIAGNRFQGELPASIANFSTTLQQLLAFNNQISGSIPEGITNLIGLTRLEISTNSFTGEIPEGIGKLERLGVLHLSNNRISGSVPATIGNITTLQRLNLFGNNLSGNIPPSLGNCKQLEVLHLSGNNLTGFIPKEVVSVSTTLSFNLSQNSLTGPLPMEVGNMSKLIELDVSNNRLSGEIPSTLSKCIMLEYLSLGDNLFRGRIPQALSALKSLQFIDLSRNKLSGQIPAYLQNLSLLESLNLSYNYLDGEVPHEGVFRNTSAFSIVGDRKLCGGIKSLGLPSCQIPVTKKRGTTLAIKIAIPVATSCSVLLAFLLVCLYRNKRPESSPSTMPPLDEMFRQVSYAEIVQATNQFSSSNLIGDGRYGFVYRGVLGNEGTVVAVKVLKLTEKGAAKSFKAECNALRNIRHRNLIKIITTCSSIDSKGDDFKALIFEFMPNGSLEEWLHQSEGDQNEHPRSLSLTQRLSIAIDTASALEYLHHHFGAAIVHGDLKPSNILLGHDMTARVGDFGLASFLSGGLPPTVSQAETSSTGIRGTIGYVAPEYGMGSKASIQGDVYSFGILLLEMFTGRKPTDTTFDDGQNIHQFTKAALPERVMEIVETSLFSEVGGDDNDNNTREGKIKDCLVAVLTMGVSCSMEPPGEQMDMRDVVAELCRIRTKTFRH
ncbi:putative receptor-like protein kinase At3g47110 isoform X3 [Rhododendron vialii]|uniref:putative receptor-like protein kinase At3g47110 isoform X3 n=1 Tax=Rhododendron vialii TaxID=182163 RepID=UPI00265F8821|nr:putative receptor-like protein kinase At3g47110 isoform X3 [Rhododendron vialii]